jgi:hypothetical protein
MPEPMTYEQRREEYRAKLAALPVRDESTERMASVLATIRARELRQQPTSKGKAS